MEDEVLTKRVSIPHQENGFNCGIFVLYSMRTFMVQAPEVFTEKCYSQVDKMVSNPWIPNQYTR